MSNIYNIFAQAEITPDINLQAEYRYRKSEFGDLSMNFDGSFYNMRRIEVRQETARLGAHYSPLTNLDAIASLIYVDRDEIQLHPDDAETSPDFIRKDQGYQGESQLIYAANQFNSITGLNAYFIDTTIGDTSFTRRQSIYNYSNINLPENIIWTVGIGYESNEQPDFSLHKLNPKLGVRWNINNNMLLRAAAFKTVKPVIAVGLQFARYPA